jgi:hypothetical protein
MGNIASNDIGALQRRATQFLMDQSRPKSPPTGIGYHMPTWPTLAAAGQGVSRFLRILPWSGSRVLPASLPSNPCRKWLRASIAALRLCSGAHVPKYAPLRCSPRLALEAPRSFSTRIASRRSKLMGHDTQGTNRGSYRPHENEPTGRTAKGTR